MAFTIKQKNEKEAIHMPENPSKHLLQQDWHSEADCADFAQRLATVPTLRQALVLLYGDLGAGKTTLVRYLLRALGVTGRIKSPTYAVVEPYAVAGLPVWHFDFYRFTDPREWEDAGFRDIFASAGLKVAEWPDNAAGLLPQADLAIHLELLDEGVRRVRLYAYTPCGCTLLSALTL